MITKFLIACNTVDGFKSFFDELIGNYATNKLIVLKGGSGVGKSTFMKSVSYEADKHNYDIWHIPCSSDINSLDCVVIPKKGIIVLDGTAPHIVDPNVPCAIGHTVNLGEFLNENEIVPHKDKIVDTINLKKINYQFMYANLKAYGVLKKNIRNCVKEFISKDLFTSIAKNIFNDYIAKQSYDGISVNGYADCLTNNNFQCIIDGLAGSRVLVSIVSDYGLNFDIIDIINRLLTGRKISKYYSPIYLDEIAHLSLGGIVISTENLPVYDYKINIDDYIPAEKFALIKDKVLHDLDMAEKLLANASDNLIDAQASHKELEKIYSKAMDFKKVEELSAHWIKRLFND